jgi:hypothetical protein
MKTAQATSEVHRAPETLSLETYALAVLNDGLRPFLSRWHPRLERWVASGQPEETWPLADLCRRDLEVTRRRVVAYARGLGRIAGVGATELELILEAPDEEAGDIVSADAIALREREMGPLLADEDAQTCRALAVAFATELPQLAADTDARQLADVAAALEAARSNLAERLVTLPTLAGYTSRLDETALALCTGRFAETVALWYSRTRGWTGDESRDVTEEERQACAQALIAAVTEGREVAGSMLAAVGLRPAFPARDDPKTRS